MALRRILIAMFLLTGLGWAESIDYQIKEIILPESPTGHIRLVALSHDENWDVTFELLEGRCPFIGETIHGSAPRDIEDTTRHHEEVFIYPTQDWSLRLRFERIYRVHAPGQ